MNIPDDFIVTMADCRAYGGCVNGWKYWVESHNLDWKSIVKNGITAKQLRDSKDANALNLLRITYERRR